MLILLSGEQAPAIIELTMNDTTRVTIEDVFIKTYSREESSGTMSGREGSIVLSTGLGTLQPAPV